MLPHLRESSSVTGSLWMLGAITSFTLLSLSGRELSGDLNAFQIMLYRSIISLLIVLALLAFGGRGDSGFGQLRTSIPGFHLARNAVHYVGQYSWFYVLPFLPLVQITAIDFSMPIWAVLLAALFLGERLTGQRIVAVLVGFSGVLVVLRPGFATFEPAALIVLGASFCYAASSRHHQADDRDREAARHPLLHVRGAALDRDSLRRFPGWSCRNWKDGRGVIAVGVSGISAHYCVARAFMVAEASVVIPIDFLRLPAIGVAAWLLYGETTEIWHIAGAGSFCWVSGSIFGRASPDSSRRVLNV